MSNTTIEFMLYELILQSKKTDTLLANKITSVLSFYIAEQKEHQNTIEQTNNSLQQCDRRNILANEKDINQDKLLEHQSRLAALGEIIDSIAHQWKQPLNSISMITDLLINDFKSGSVDGSYIQELDDNIHTQIDHMITTLSEFRTFFRPDTKNESFTLLDVLKSVQILMKDELISQNVLLYFEIDEHLSIFGNENEIKHVFINLINNAIDSFNENNINSRKIHLRWYEKNNDICIEVEDNAGGIPLNVIKDIFKANVTTKKEKGTGIGLYMSKQIINKNHGSINVHNTNYGALFTITIPRPTR